MCYSAKVRQSLKDYLRETNAYADLAQIEETYRRCLTDKSVRIPRGFERNFDQPSTPSEQRIRDLIDQHRAAAIPKFEQEIFTQRKRLADAERTLKTKQTKKALEDQRISTSKIDIALEKLSLLTGTQPHPDDDRIFPMTYVPIVVKDGAAASSGSLAITAGKRASRPRSIGSSLGSITPGAITWRSSGAPSSATRTR